MPEYRIRVSVSVGAYGEQYSAELEQGTRYFYIPTSSAEDAMRTMNNLTGNFPLLTVDVHEEKKRAAEAADAS